MTESPQLKAAEVASNAFVILLISLVTAHFLTPHPVNKIGKRPLGRGIWTYLSSQLFSSHSGVYGYDSSLGALNPVLRILVHVAGVVFLQALLLRKFSLLLNQVDIFSNHNFTSGFFALSLYLFSFWAYDKVTYGVSHPGGPREHKIRRMPKWSDVTTSIDDVIGDKAWKCAVAQNSHRVTLERFGLGSKDGENGMKCNEVGMSGEPAGRQMWAVSTSKEFEGSPITEDQKALIRTIAKCGREGFNPSKNPNSGDFLLREQLISNYVAKGGRLPDMEKECKTVKESARKAVHFYSMLQTEDGHFAGDYGGPHFLMPGLIFAW
jgi:hypothetical protein